MQIGFFELEDSYNINKYMKLSNISDSLLSLMCICDFIMTWICKKFYPPWFIQFNDMNVQIRTFLCMQLVIQFCHWFHPPSLQWILLNFYFFPHYPPLPVTVKSLLGLNILLTTDRILAPSVFWVSFICKILGYRFVSSVKSEPLQPDCVSEWLNNFWEALRWSH